MMKTLYFTLVALFFTSILVGQEVKFKNKSVFIDKQEALRYEQPFLADEITFKKLDSQEEVVYIKPAREDRGKYNEIVYYTLVFVQEKVSFETQKFNQKGMKSIFKQLVKEGVVLPDGTVNIEAMERFKVKYEDSLTKLLIR
ncbi:hypothetical protein HX004_16490 [Myroides sp. 1354]|uniref:hypothetical protein n=1 Tax=unclassified Myroides TaxID=2642485 RepID=UPI002575E5D5|nr:MULTISPECIES: hypothetical protein [unclassified Myroides]MDM1046419.1 hypothetical protein [Myroides sp. R163-1]MDM1057356.1 hypothetical protein [Myroides sp. 1354]MDM1070631.1 hypothetical protein [Myroides sp. 1372]